MKLKIIGNVEKASTRPHKENKTKYKVLYPYHFKLNYGLLRRRSTTTRCLVLKFQDARPFFN